MVRRALRVIAVSMEVQEVQELQDLMELMVLQERVEMVALMERVVLMGHQVHREKMVNLVLKALMAPRAHQVFAVLQEQAE